MRDIVWVSPQGHRSVSVSRLFPSAGTAVSLFRAKTVQQRPLLSREVETRLPDCGVTHQVRIDHLSRLPVMPPSTIAVRPRDAVSSQLQQYIISDTTFYYELLLLQIYCCVQLNSVLFSVVVVHAGCDKQHSLTCAVNCTVDHFSCCLHSNSHRSNSQILAEKRDFCLPHLHSMHSLGGSLPPTCIRCLHQGVPFPPPAFDALITVFPHPTCIRCPHYGVPIRIMP